MTTQRKLYGLTPAQIHEAHTTPVRNYILELPIEDFVAITHLVEQACARNSDVRVKGFYLKVLENLQQAYKENKS